MAARPRAPPRRESSRWWRALLLALPGSLWLQRPTAFAASCRASQRGAFGAPKLAAPGARPQRPGRGLGLQSSRRTQDLPAKAGRRGAGKGKWLRRAAWGLGPVALGLSWSLPALALAGLVPRDARTLPFAGFMPSFLTVVLSELGDKTFFVAMILSLRRGRTRALTASLTALYAMTVISTILGIMVKSFPAAWEGGEGAVNAMGAALFLFFGISSLLQARSARQKKEEEEKEAEEEVEGTLDKKAKNTGWREWWQCVVLVFIAEWADRSMLAQIALAATWNPVGVIAGGLLGHTIATSLAVFGGDLLQKYMDDSTAKIIGGVLFIFFAITTAMGIY